MKQYDLSAIMSRAWAIFRKGGIVFAEALHRRSMGKGRENQPATRGLHHEKLTRAPTPPAGRTHNRQSALSGALFPFIRLQKWS